MSYVPLPLPALVGGGFLAWLAAHAWLAPPGGVDGALRREEALARAEAVAPEALAFWGLDAGERLQASAFRDGWSADEAFRESERRTSFVWIEGPSASLSFASPAWPEASIALRGYPLDALAPLRVQVELDGEPRADLVLGRGWSTARARLGPVDAGPHVLTLRPERRQRPPREPRTLSLAVDALAVGPDPGVVPERDHGLFVAWLPAGCPERPVLVAPRDRPAPGAATWSRDLGRGLAAHGFGRPPRAGAALLEAVTGLLAAALVTLLAGLPWALLAGASGLGVLPAALLASAAATAVGFAALRALGVAPSPLALCCCLAALAGVPFASRRVRRARLAVPALPLALAAATAAVLTPMAVRVVPPLEEHDMEAAGTAHALATRLAPWSLTNRGTTAFFAEPPAQHLWQAAALALSGRLPRLAFHEHAALEARRGGFREPPAGDALEGRPHYATWRVLHRRFLAEPQLWPIRQVTVLLSALGIGLLAWLAAELAGSRLAGGLIALLVLSLPEQLVRGAYGGFHTSAVLASVLVVAAVHAGARPAGLAAAGALGGLTAKKALLVPVAWLLAASRGAGVRRVAPLGGALAGLLLFAAWALGSDRATFLHEFVREHVVRRFALAGVRETGFYPSAGELWAEFARAHGLAFTLVAGLAALRGLSSERPAARAAAVATLLGAVAFSVTDWRQTKHLALLVPLAAVAGADAWPRGGSGRRRAVLLVLALLALNLAAAARLVARFESLRPSTLW